MSQSGDGLTLAGESLKEGIRLYSSGGGNRLQHTTVRTGQADCMAIHGLIFDRE